MKPIARILPLVLVFASAGASASSLPQMDPTWYPNQLLWLAVSFAMLYAAVSLVFAPRIKSILDVRARAIDDAITQAELAKSAAESSRGTAESASLDARAAAAEILSKMQAENSRDASDAIAKLDREIERRIGHASAVLEESVKKAATGVDAAATDLALAMVARLTQRDRDASGDAEPKLKLVR